MTIGNLTAKNPYFVTEAKDLAILGPVWEENLPVLSTTSKKFQWYYADNPLGKGVCLLLHEAAGSRAIGAAGIGFRRFMINGKEVTAALVADLAVNKEHRTLYPALMLQRRIIERASEGAAFIYGMPNTGATAVFNRLGYKKIAVISRYALVIRSAEYVKKRLNGSMLSEPASSLVDAFRNVLVLKTWKGAPRGYAIDIVKTFDGRFDVLWERASRNFRCTAARDSRFLNWRYSECPERRYFAFTLSGQHGKGALAGYVVYYIKDRAVHIDDILSADNDGALEALLIAFVRSAKEMDMDSISIGISSGHVLTGMLERHGFRKRTDARDIEVHAHPCGDVKQIENHDWSFTWGDQDNS